MPQLDFRQALSSPEEKPIPSVEAVQSAPPRSLAGVPAANQSKDLIGRVRLSRSQMTNISFVTIACVGGLACAFYFFNGAEFLRAAAAWAGEFLYPRPASLAANSDISKQQNGPNQAGNPGTPSQGPNRPSPFDKSIWPSNLNQPATFANVSPSGSGPGGNGGGGPPFSGGGSLFNQLNQLARGADTLFQSFYQTAISMAPKKVSRTVSRTTTSARNRISRVQQTVNGQRNGAGTTARSATQAANAQNQAAINAARMQSQSQMGGFQGGGAPLGGGTGLGGTGLGGTGLGGTGLGGTGLGGGGLGGVAGGLGRH
jgi:hypothetical protein